MNNKIENKSLFLYTGLIFVVALIIIIVTFFGQDRILRETNEQIQTATAGITERAAILSDENMRLTEKALSLEKQVEELTSENEIQKKKEANYDLIFECYSLISAQDFASAKTKFDTIDASLLSEKSLAVYNDINTQLAQFVTPAPADASTAPTESVSPVPTGSAK